MTSLDKPTEDTQARDDARAVTEAALFEAFGGVRGMVETVLPGLLFVTIFTIITTATATPRTTPSRTPRRTTPSVVTAYTSTSRW
ncbi:hypothetical protein ABZ372_30085, partial [Streptomyces sp. NPDC005921]